MRLKWAEGALANVADPGAELADVGYDDQAQLPAAEYNFMLRELMRAARKGLPSVADGIELTDPGDSFLVAPPDALPGAVIEDCTVDAFTRCVTDGLRVYASVSDMVYALDPRDWSVLWNTTVPYDVSALCVAHGMLLVGVTGMAEQEKLVRLNPATGAVVATCMGGVDDDAAPLAIAASPDYVFYCTSDDYSVRRLSAATLAEVDVYNHGASVFDIATDHDTLYVLGVAGVGGVGAGKTLMAFNFALAAAGGVTFTVGAGGKLVADCEHVFVLLADSEDFHKFDRALQPVASPWHDFTGMGFQNRPVGHDAERLYIVSAGLSNRIWAISKASGGVVWVCGRNSFNALCSDGMVVYGAGYNAGGTERVLVKVASHAKTRRYARTAHGAELA